MRLTLASPKGGVGKTTLAGTLAALGQSQGRQTIALDLDSNGGLSSWMGPRDRPASLYEDLRAERQAGLVQSPAVEGLYLALASADLAELDGDFDKTPRRLARSVTSLKPDLMVFDTPPGWSALTSSALLLSDVCILVVECSDLGMAGLGPMVEAVHQIRSGPNPKLRPLIALNKRARTRASRMAEEQIRDTYKHVIGAIRSAAVLQTAVSRRSTVWTVAPKHPVTEDFRALWAAIQKEKRK